MRDLASSRPGYFSVRCPVLLFAGVFHAEGITLAASLSTHFGEVGGALAPRSQATSYQEALQLEEKQSDTFFDDSEVEASGAVMSMAVKCIVVIMFQYFGSHICAAVCRGHLLGDALEQSITATTVLPMVGVLLLVTQTRAEQVTRPGGPPELYGLPFWWERSAMLVGVCAGIVAQCFQFLSAVRQRPSLVEGQTAAGQPVLEALRWVSTLFQYISFAIVVAATFSMQAPFDVWLMGYRSLSNMSTSPAVGSVVALTVQYFVFSLALATFTLFHRFRLGAQAAKAAVATQSLGPMLCVLFLAVRLRALQVVPGAALDPKEALELGGRPLQWAEAGFRICTHGLLVQTLLAAAIGLSTGVPQPRSEEPLSQEEKREDTRRHSFILIFDFLRRVASVVVHVAAAIVLICCFCLEAPGGPRATPPYPGVVKVLIVLTVQFFATDLLCFIASCCERAGEEPLAVPDGSPASRLVPAGLVQVLHAMKDASQFCPMLCVLFLGVRLRAVSIDTGANPQNWVQAWMWVCMWASVLQLIFTVATCGVGHVPSNTALAVKAADKEDEVESVAQAKCPQAVGAICKGVCMLTIYIGVIVVLAGTIRMSAATVAH